MIKSQKRLTIFLPALYGGGAERTMLNLAHGIADRGYLVDLVLAQAEGPYLAEIPESVRLVDLGKGSIVNRNRTLMRLPSLIRYLRVERPDALLSALSRANLVAICASRIAGKPNRVVVNQQNTVSKDAPNFPDRLGRQAPRLAKYIYRWADYVVGVSQGVVDDLVQSVGVPRHLVKVIFNPGITPELRKKAQERLDHPWFQPGEPPVIVAVGRLSMQKDFPNLIKAFAQLHQTRPVRLLILGEGVQRETLEELAAQLGVEQDFALPGFIDNPYPYIVNASVFVLSSQWEGLPTVLVEALYCGPPIVATDCPSGPREILQNGEFGRLVPVGDSETLAEAIGDALDGKISRPPIESWQPYDLETVVDQYVDLLLNGR
jgi:glycosyltransferase involved in cell wall biosynthesis